jgi:biopolymer transport protein ExbD
MKFPRNEKILRSPFEVAPFAAVFFLLVMFLMLSTLLPTPGVLMQLQPPAAADLPGIRQPSIAVALDANGRFYFRNQAVTEMQLRSGLSNVVKNSSTPLTLVIHADKSISYDRLLHLTLLARDAGINNALLATLPRADAR